MGLRGRARVRVGGGGEVGGWLKGHVRVSQCAEHLEVDEELGLG